MTVAPRVLALLPALVFLPIILAPPMNHDVAAVLSFSQRWLAGEHLYSDLLDVNPPLIFVLNLLPAAMARWTGMDAVLALQLCLLAFVALCWRLAFVVRDRAAEGPALRAFLDVLPGLFGLACGYDFGQREILMATAALPYLMAAARRAEGQRPRGRVASALVAGLGFALKPYFLAVPALAEGVVIAVRRGRWPADPAPWVLAAVWAGYAASLPLVFPNYLNVVVPLARSLYAPLGGFDAITVLLLPRFFTALVLFTPLLVVTIGLRRGPGVALPRMLAAGGLGSLASAVVQHKGWSYHIVPIELFGCGLGGVLAARWLDGLGAARTPGQAQGIAAGLAGLFALYAISNGEAPWNELDYRHGDIAGLTRLLRRDAGGRDVLVFSPGIAPIFPALNYAHARLTLNAMNMWLLEGVYGTCPANGQRYHDVAEMGAAELRVYRGVAEDFARAPPAAVVVDAQPGIPWCGSEFGFIEYFTRNPVFAGAWSHYRLAGEQGRYRVFTRKD